MKNTPYLLIDKRIVSRKENVALVLGKAQKEVTDLEDNPLLYPDVIYDEEEQLYKCWYHGSGRDVGTCYASSTDGVHWDKATEPLHVAGAAGVFKDYGDPDPARRYKIVYSGGPLAAHSPEALDWWEKKAQSFGGNRMGLRLGVSPDGIRWKDNLDFVIPWRGCHCDTHNMLFYDERLQKYVIFTRLWTKSHHHVGIHTRRLLGRIESDNCRDWSFPQEIAMDFPEDPSGWVLQPHDMGAMPYADQYLGVMTVLNHRGPWYPELTWSPDSITWHRVCPGEHLIPRSGEGADEELQVVPAYMPIMRPDETRLYYEARNALGKRYLGLARFGPDRLAGMSTTSIGTIETCFLECTNKNLYVNYSTNDEAAREQSVRVALVSHSNARGQHRLNGERQFDDCEDLKGDAIDGRVVWREGGDLTPFIGFPVRLYFELTQATLYSFRFGD